MIQQKANAMYSSERRRLFLISLASAAIGYVIADWFWRRRMGRKWQARKLRIGKVHKSGALEKVTGA